jgi:hypothetical protein
VLGTFISNNTSFAFLNLKNKKSMQDKRNDLVPHPILQACFGSIELGPYTKNQRR